MIQEDYVNFKCAKLLKEKGFDIESIKSWYCEYDSSNTTHEFNEHEYPLITLQMAMKWLRENHRLFIEIGVSIDLNGNYHYDFIILNYLCKHVLSINDYAKMGPKDTFEEAAQSAIMYCLNNLI